MNGLAEFKLITTVTLICSSSTHVVAVVVVVVVVVCNDDEDKHIPALNYPTQLALYVLNKLIYEKKKKIKLI